MSAPLGPGSDAPHVGAVSGRDLPGRPAEPAEPAEPDALLVLSFGGPDGPDDVRPFLENVTRGRGVPPERLDAVVEHYLHFGGVSPINALNRDLIARVERRFAERGIALPVYFGNRNWHPFVEDTVAAMARDGVRSALVFATSAWGGYSGCRQYLEDITRARAALDGDAPTLVRLRQFHDHPLFVAAAADALTSAVADLVASEDGIGPEDVRVVFTAHSVPESADRAAGRPAEGGRLYSRQVAEAARLVADTAGIDAWDLVWQSRSGPPQVPWLEPDVCDHLRVLADDGARAVVVCPVGFVSDHLEVVWDLDTEAADVARERGLAYRRAGTVGTDARFVDLVCDLVDEHVAGRPPARLGSAPQYGCTRDGAPCATDCCVPVRRPAPGASS